MSSPEADTRPTVLVVWRWRWLVVVGTLICVLGAAVVTRMLPRTYGMRATVSTGDVIDESREADRLVARVTQRFTVRAQALPAGAMRQAALIELTTESQDRDEALRRLQRAGEGLVSELDHMFDRQLALYRTSARFAEELRGSLVHLREARDAAVRRSADAAGVLLAARLADEVLSRETRLYELERQLAERGAPKLRPQLVTAPQVQPAPLRPRLAVNLAIGLVTGITGSLILAVLLDGLGASGPRPR